MAMSQSELLTEREVETEIFRGLITVKTLQRWRREAKGPPCCKLGRRVVYRRADVLAWIDRSQIQTEVPPPDAFK
jgi:hypothetical protein